MHTDVFCGYVNLLSTVFVSSSGHDNPEIVHTGFSCPIDLRALKRVQNASEFIYVSHINDFDLGVDVASVSAHVADSVNYIFELHGVGKWLQTAYADWQARDRASWGPEDLLPFLQRCV